MIPYSQHFVVIACRLEDGTVQTHWTNTCAIVDGGNGSLCFVFVCPLTLEPVRLDVHYEAHLVGRGLCRQVQTEVCTYGRIEPAMDRLRAAMEKNP